LLPDARAENAACSNCDFEERHHIPPRAGDDPGQGLFEFLAKASGRDIMMAEENVREGHWLRHGGRVSYVRVNLNLPRDQNAETRVEQGQYDCLPRIPQGMVQG